MRATPAFVAAKYMKDRLPSVFLGPDTTVVAHSLGNALVSSAIQDHGMDVGNYVMLNPAVPTESYDGRAEDIADVARRNMTHPDWRGQATDGSLDYPERVMAAGWSTLFPSSDPRSKVTWDNRFGGVLDATKVWQYYSSGEGCCVSLRGECLWWSTGHDCSFRLATSRYTTAYRTRSSRTLAWLSSKNMLNSSPK